MMYELTRKEKIERIRLFLSSKTYTYIKDIYGTFLNGYILRIDKNEFKIMFNDDFIPLPIPIIIDDISEITYSKRKKEIKK